MQVAGAVARAVQRRISWDTVAVALSLAIIAAACFSLFHLLRDIDVGKIGAAISATPMQAVVAAGLLIAGSYVCLTFYDFFALRTIGQSHIPYRVAAFTGFLSYTIGHNLGATVLTGGVVRYRIYRAWGLTLIDVAKVAFVTGLTFWLGNAVVLGVGIAYAPEVAGSNQPAAVVDQPDNRARCPRHHCDLSALAGPATARHWTRRLEAHAAERAVDPAADRYRDRRSRPGGAGHVRAHFSPCPGRAAGGDRDLRARRAAWISSAMPRAVSACSMRRCWSRCRRWKRSS